MLLHSPVIIQDTRPKIVDAPLTLISRMGQGVCHLRFYLLRWPILFLLMDATMQPLDCWMCKTVNCLHSVDAHLRALLRDILTVIGYPIIVHKMHTVFIDSQYSISTYYHFHPKPSRPLGCWAPTIHVTWMINDIGPLRFNAFGRQFTAQKSIL